ncbi:MAG: prephenate dehydratase domain-containing protein [Kiritimatiellia bacterium]
MPNLYYLGPEETFSHRTATRMALSGEMLVPCTDFSTVFASVARDSEGSAVIPFENSTHGPVTEVMDLLADYPSLTIVECRTVPVHHHLLTRDMTTPIALILSKAEALSQCRTTLRKIYPNIPQEAVSSTAEAARQASLDSAIAAVAGETTAERYGLCLRRPEVQDVQGNTTRFFRLEHHRLPVAAIGLPPTHALLYVIIDDRPGALLSVLETLRDIDLTFIQSRPIAGEKWKYAFFLELLVGAGALPLAAVLGGLRPFVREVRLLGSYSITTQPAPVAGTVTTTLSNLRAMIATLDGNLVKAFGKRADFHSNSALYVHVEPVTHEALAKAFVHGDATERTRLLRRFYLTTVIPVLAETGADNEPRPALHADADAMAALDRRFRFASKVVARKRIELAPELRAAVRTNDPEKVEASLLNVAVEEKVLARAADFCAAEGATPEQAARVMELYRAHLLPISRLIQVYDILGQTAFATE